MNKLLLDGARKVWRNVLPLRLRLALNGTVNGVLQKSLLQGQPTDTSLLKPGPLIVSGFLSETLGIGRAGRMTLDGLREAGLEPRTHDIRAQLHSRRFDAAGPDEPGGVWLLHCNPLEALAAGSSMARSQWMHRYRIGYWAYELPCGPAEWFQAARFFHEIWTPSQFVADAFGGIGPPVRVMPHYHAEQPTADRAGMRMRLGLGDEVFVVGAAGDLKSSEFRKNLTGAIEIYKAAFEAASESVQLLIKLSSGSFDPSARERLISLVAGRPDIRIVEEHFSHAEISDFFSSMDVFLSPHRSEGYGLTITEALLSNVAVLATGWSGNIDYMSGLNPFLIDYRLVPASDPTGIYKPTSEDFWAEPDIADGVRKLRHLKTNPGDRKSLCKQARHRIMAANGAWAIEELDLLPWRRLVAS